MRVLVVEDNAALAAQLRGALVEAGFAVDAAADGEEALFLGETEPYDAVVLDLGLPKLDGFGVLERLQADPETRWLPVVVLTARRLSAAERQSLQARALALLDKSTYSPNELRRLIELALAQ